MGCTTSRKNGISIAKEAYGNFAKGDIKAILANGTPDASFTFVGSEAIPYTGEWKGTEKVGEFFKTLGGSWGEKQILVAFEPSDFKEEGNKVTNKVLLRVLTTSGKVIAGVETHEWEVDVESGKWVSIKVTQDEQAHDLAFDAKTNQSELMCKLCWAVFKEGKVEVIIEKLNTESSKFTVMADNKDAWEKVPYAGEYEGKNMAEAFKKMFESWKMDKTFKFDATEYKAVGTKVTMGASITANTVRNTKIEGNEVHTATTVLNDDGCIQCSSWTVTECDHHIQAF